MKYRKKPIEVEAFRLFFHPYPEWFFDQMKAGNISLVLNGPGDNRVEIRTLEGEMMAYKGDYIIRGVKGEIYPCKADIFEMTYEKVEGENDGI